MGKTVKILLIIIEQHCMVCDKIIHMNSVMENGEKIVFISDGHKHWEGNKYEVLKSDCGPLNDFIFANALAKQLKEDSKK